MTRPRRLTTPFIRRTSRDPDGILRITLESSAQVPRRAPGTCDGFPDHCSKVAHPDKLASPDSWKRDPETARWILTTAKLHLLIRRRLAMHWPRSRIHRCLCYLASKGDLDHVLAAYFTARGRLIHPQPNGQLRTPTAENSPKGRE